MSYNVFMSHCFHCSLDGPALIHKIKKGKKKRKKKRCFCKTRGKNTFENTEVRPCVAGVQLLFTLDSCMDSVEMSSWTNLLDVCFSPLCLWTLLWSFLYGVDVWGNAAAKGTRAVSFAFLLPPSHTPLVTQIELIWRWKRLKSDLFHPSIGQLASWEGCWPSDLGEGVGAQFGCALGGTLSCWSCPWALSYAIAHAIKE